MKTKGEYINELSILDGIKKCVFRYAISISEESDETQSEWCKEYLDYLRNRESKIKNKLHKLK